MNVHVHLVKKKKKNPTDYSPPSLTPTHQGISLLARGRPVLSIDDRASGGSVGRSGLIFRFLVGLVLAGRALVF